MGDAISIKPASAASASLPGMKGSLDRGGVAWALFEGGRTPFLILITIYIFMPYVASTLIGDPVRGQEVISFWQQVVGLMAGLTAALWWGKPDGSGLHPRSQKSWRRQADA